MSNYYQGMDGQHPAEKILSLMNRKLSASYGYIRRRMAECGLDGLDVSHGDILWQLYSKGPRTMGELASGIGRDKSTVTALVNKMEARGLVLKRRDKADTRITLVELAERGESYREPFQAISREIRGILWEGFSERERADLAGLLARLGEPEDT